MISSPNDDGFAQQLAAIRQRLASLRDRIEAQSGFDSVLQCEILEALRAVLSVLESPEISAVEHLHALLQRQQILLREVHHRIKNNLQIVTTLLDLQAIQTEDPTIQALLRENQRRIRLIALVHEQLSESENTTEINLGEYVRNLATILVRTYAIDPNQVTFNTAIDADLVISPARAIPIGLILNELISNAFKHGLRDGAGEVTIALRITSNQQGVLSVTNTGNPLPPGFDPSVARSLGLQLVNMLVQQIDGSLEVDRTDQTTIQVSFAVSNSVV